MEWFLHNRDLRHERYWRHSSSTYTKSLFLHVVKHNLLFFCSIWLFFLEDSIFTGPQMKGRERGWMKGERSVSLCSFYLFYLLHRHLEISWVIAAESSPLHITGSRHDMYVQFGRVYLFMGRLRIALAFLFLSIAPFGVRVSTRLFSCYF